MPFTAPSFNRRAFLLAAAPFGVVLARPAAPLPGTFLQFWSHHLAWDETAWKRLFEFLAVLRMREIVIQWSAYGSVDFTPLVEEVLARSQAARISVLVGLAHRDSYWKDLDARDTRILNDLRARNLELADRLCRRVRASRAFRGWYLPEEIDDVHWNQPAQAAALGEHLRLTRAGLRRLTPHSSVAVSGFSNRLTAPAALAAFWKGLVKRSGMDTVLFQDGIGAGKMTLESWPAYLDALSLALGRRLRVVVEVFEQQRDAGEFRAVPAPLERILKQARLASQGGAIAFSVPEYLTPLGGAESARRFEQYLSGPLHP